MKIRQVKKDDFDQYKILRKKGLEDYKKLTGEKLKISSKTIKEEFNNLFKNKKRFMFVIEENRKIKAYLIGTLIKNVYQNMIYLDDIFVEKNSRKKGFGKLILKKFIDWSKSKKFDKIRLGVRIENKRAISLYKNMGFKIKHYEMEFD